jgi:hypothetical protein
MGGGRRGQCAEPELELVSGLDPEPSGRYRARGVTIGVTATEQVGPDPVHPVLETGLGTVAGTDVLVKAELSIAMRRHSGSRIGATRP